MSDKQNQDKGSDKQGVGNQSGSEPGQKGNPNENKKSTHGNTHEGAKSANLEDDQAGGGNQEGQNGSQPDGGKQGGSR